MLELMTCRQLSSLDLDTEVMEAMEATEDTEGTEDTVGASGEDTDHITVLEAMNIIVSEALEDSEDTAQRSITLANSKDNLSILANKEFKLSFHIEVKDGN